MSEAIMLAVDGFSLERGDDGEIRVRDIDLAERLGYERPRDIRKLIERMSETGELSAFQRRATVARQRTRFGEREFEATEYWLDEIEALLVVMQSSAPNAVAMRRTIAVVFRKALQKYEESRSALRRLPEHIERWFLLPAAADFVALWPDSLVREIERLHGREWGGGRHPHHMKSTYPGIYRAIMTRPVAKKMMATNPDRDRIRHHQLVTPEARPFVVAQLAIVESIARQSRDKADFWRRLDREYGGGLLQLTLSHDAAE